MEVSVRLLNLDDPSAAKNSTAEFVICRAQCLRRSGTRYKTSCSPLHRAAAIFFGFNAGAVRVPPIHFAISSLE